LYTSYAAEKDKTKHIGKFDNLKMGKIQNDPMAENQSQIKAIHPLYTDFHREMDLFKRSIFCLDE
jgi:hypothetical protein